MDVIRDRMSTAGGATKELATIAEVEAYTDPRNDPPTPTQRTRWVRAHLESVPGWLRDAYRVIKQRNQELSQKAEDAATATGRRHYTAAALGKYLSQLLANSMSLPPPLITAMITAQSAEAFQHVPTTRQRRAVRGSAAT